ncbi:AraC family transcriptional regulator [Flavicella sediminum]|uniref:AraC family transcriptional regulator n=1 Tax=Flavicella sediminum TaxID=2585141 RepID=UPI0011235533|nr:AraC family transcriptional regulator [Flavicella sediminum]
MDNTTLREGFMGQKIISHPKSIINIIKNNKISKSLYISDLGYYPKAHHHYRFRKKGADQYIFIYCTKGKGEILLNDTKIQISPNQFYIIPKNTKHEYKADEKNPWSIYWLHYKGILAPPLYDRFVANKNIDIPFTVEKINLFEKIFSLFDSNNLENQIEYANLLSLNFISTFIYHNFETNHKTHINLNDNIIDSIKDYLLERLDQNLTLDQIASKFNYSKSYLHAKFKTKTGYSIMVFFNLKKVQKACEYLSYTDYSIKEISFKTGFEDPLYFSRIFKNYMGKSPRDYKKHQHK